MRFLSNARDFSRVPGLTQYAYVLIGISYLVETLCILGLWLFGGTEMDSGVQNLEKGIREELSKVRGRVFIELRQRSEGGESRCLALVDVDVNDVTELVFRGEGGGEEVYTFSTTEQQHKEANMDRNNRKGSRNDNPFHQAEERLREAFGDHFEEVAENEEFWESMDDEYVPFEELDADQQLEVIKDDLQFLDERVFGGFLGHLLRKAVGA